MISYSITITDWWFLKTTPLKNHGVRQLGLFFPRYGRIKHVPNDQPVIINHD